MNHIQFPTALVDPNDSVSQHAYMAQMSAQDGLVEKLIAHVMPFALRRGLPAPVKESFRSGQYGMSASEQLAYLRALQDWADEVTRPKQEKIEPIDTPLGVANDLGTRAKVGDLMASRIDPTRWVVPDLLPDGLALLAGPPKLGKSWMVLDMAVSVAAGRPVMGRDVEQGDVLYLALEDNWRRLQGRVRTVLGDTPVPFDHLEMWTESGTLTSSLIPQIEGWLDGAENPRLVIIDTLGRVQEGSAWADRQDGGYADAVTALAGLQGLAAERHIAVVVVTHTKKGGWAKDADPLEAVLGSQGYAGTADAILVLKRERGSANGELFVTGREIDEEVVEAVHFDHGTCRWLVGDEEYPTLADQLLDFLEERDPKGYMHAWKLTATEIAQKLHRRRDEVQEALDVLWERGDVTVAKRRGRGTPAKLYGPKAPLPEGLERMLRRTEEGAV